MSDEEIQFCVLLCGNPQREVKSEIPPDGLTPQQMALLTQSEGVGSSHLPYVGDGCCDVQVELHYISRTC